MISPRRSDRHQFSALASTGLLLALGATALLVSCRGGDGSAGRSAARPNILLISLCSVRPDHMQCYGYARETTPTLSAFARDAVVFTHAVTPWPKTVPAFAAIMTGKYPHTTHVMRMTPRQRLADEHVTLAEAFQAAGYATGAFISTPALNPAANIGQGFDRRVETYLNERKYEYTTHAAAEWLKQLPAGKPYFAWVHYNNAHYPYTAESAPDPNMFVGDAHYDPARKISPHPTGRLPLNVPDSHPCALPMLRADLGYVHSEALLPERPDEFAFYVARYDAGIFAADRMIGELLARLREAGKLDNTIVALVGDHGEALGEHNFYFEHGRFPYDDTLRVPLMIRVPNQAPRQIATPVESFSLMPTLLELAGVPVAGEVEARSLAPLLAGRDEGGLVFSESGYQFEFTLSVRDSQLWKLIHVPSRADRALMSNVEFELYDLNVDPAELTNLYTSQPQRAAGLRRALEQWSAPWIRDAYSVHSLSDAPLDAETIRQLRTLGYVGDDADSPAAASSAPAGSTGSDPP
ncbi:MAG: Arylsulfatase [Phycisphaerae bacterium]|nr:Arylsulfatase [Phycisphaerae bacterium]